MAHSPFTKRLIADGLPKPPRQRTTAQLVEEHQAMLSLLKRALPTIRASASRHLVAEVEAVLNTVQSEAA